VEYLGIGLSILRVCVIDLEVKKEGKMCEYCDLYDRHIDVAAKIIALCENEGLEFTETIQLLLYMSGFLWAGMWSIDQDHENVINNCFNAALSRGSHHRVQKEESEKNYQHEGEPRNSSLLH